MKKTSSKKSWFKVYFKTGNVATVSGKTVLDALMKSGVRNEGVVKYDILNELYVEE